MKGMYGVGNFLVLHLMAEIGNVSRFERKQSLVVFAGTGPIPTSPGRRTSAVRGLTFYLQACFLKNEKTIENISTNDYAHADDQLTDHHIIF